MVQRESLSAHELLETIFSYVTKLSSMKEHEKMLIVLADMGRVLSNAERCSVWLLSEDKKRLWTKVAHGIEALEIQSDLGIVGDAIKNDRKLIIDDVYKDPRFNADIDKQTGYKTKSMMVVPIYDDENEVMGAFQVVNSRSSKEIFETRDQERLLLASSYASEILIASKLAQEIEETQKEVVFTMGAIGESRSKETGNHVKRVAQYSKILALALGLSEDEAELLKNASPMHDIGKVAIPDAILNKPGRFNDEERAIMDTHAELGYKMIKNSNRPLLQAASIVAYQHHEKWDGSGYPQGLRGEDIHIYGRITALADVFDALGSDRCYKKAWDLEKIYALLQEERGKHFDPQLIDVFFENLETILDVREKLKDEFEDE
jgi:HD-GYP domain-containing protein (c-di-GMP phosphodiesterase class II)